MVRTRLCIDEKGYIPPSEAHRFSIASVAVFAAISFAVGVLPTGLYVAHFGRPFFAVVIL